MRTGRDGTLRGRLALLVGMMLCLAMGLAACGAGATNAASAAGTPNCAPATRTVQARSVTGTISSVGANSLQVTDTASGQAVTVELTSSTRITRIMTTSASSLTPGSLVQVTADPSGTTAQRIIITPQGANGFGNGGARGTPPAGFNPACVGTRTPRQPGQGTFRGGVRGTVSSVTSTRVVVTDARGQTLTFAITPSTVILTTATATPGDLKAGGSVIVTGTMSGSNLVARAIVIQPAASQ